MLSSNTGNSVVAEGPRDALC